MPKHTRKKRWEHPHLKSAYCIERYGNVYTTIFGRNARVIKGLKWDEANKETALRVLAERYYKELELLGNDEIVPSKSYMLSDGIKAFLEYKKSRVSAWSLVGYKTAIKKLITSNYPCDSKYIHSMVTQNYNKAYTRNPNTAIRYFSIVKHMFDYLATISYVEINPFNKQIHDKPVSQLGYMLSPAELEMIIEIISKQLPESYSPLTNTESKHYRTFILLNLVLFLSKYGLRINEALNLHWEDSKDAPYIAYDNQKRRTIINNDVIIVDGKRSNFRIPKIREIPIDFISGGREVIDTLRENRINDKVFAGEKLQTISTRIMKVMIEANITEKARFHIFRRYAINYWEKEMNIPPYLCAYLAGHTLAVRQSSYNEMPNATSLLRMIEKSK